MPKSYLSLPLSLGLAAVLLSGCYVPRPDAHSQLRISKDGAYALDGVQTSPQELSERIRAAERPGADLVVEIHASPAADMVSTRQAVAAVRAAHATVAFAKAAPDL